MRPLAAALAFCLLCIAALDALAQCPGGVCQPPSVAATVRTRQTIRATIRVEQPQPAPIVCPGGDCETCPYAEACPLPQEPTPAAPRQPARTVTRRAIRRPVSVLIRRPTSSARVILRFRSCPTCP